MRSEYLLVNPYSHYTYRGSLQAANQSEVIIFSNIQNRLLGKVINISSTISLHAYECNQRLGERLLEE